MSNENTQSRIGESELPSGEELTEEQRKQIELSEDVQHETGEKKEEIAKEAEKLKEQN